MSVRKQQFLTPPFNFIPSAVRWILCLTECCDAGELVNGHHEMQFWSTLELFSFSSRRLNSELFDSGWIELFKVGLQFGFCFPSGKINTGHISFAMLSEYFYSRFLLSLENSNSQNNFLWINILYWNTFCYLEFLKNCLKNFFGSQCFHILQSFKICYALKRWYWKWFCKKVFGFHATVVGSFFPAWIFFPSLCPSFRPVFGLCKYSWAWAALSCSRQCYLAEAEHQFSGKLPLCFKALL